MNSCICASFTRCEMAEEEGYPNDYEFVSDLEGKYEMTADGRVMFLKYKAYCYVEGCKKCKGGEPIAQGYGEQAYFENAILNHVARSDAECHKVASQQAGGRPSEEEVRLAILEHELITSDEVIYGCQEVEDWHLANKRKAQQEAARPSAKSKGGSKGSNQAAKRPRTGEAPPLMVAVPQAPNPMQQTVGMGVALGALGTRAEVAATVAMAANSTLTQKVNVLRQARWFS